MNLWDLDGTIYDGEILFDFYVFCLKKEKSLIRYFPVMAKTLLLYKLGFMTIEQLEISASYGTSAFVKYQVDFNELADEFWANHKHKLKPIILSMIEPDHGISTSSPEFLINPIKSLLKAKVIICTEFDTKKGIVLFANFGVNKVISFKKRFPGVKINNFYTDNPKSDAPLIEIAKRAFLVKGDNFTKIK